MVSREQALQSFQNISEQIIKVMMTAACYNNIQQCDWDPVAHGFPGVLLSCPAAVSLPDIFMSVHLFSTFFFRIYVAGLNPLQSPFSM